MRKRPRKRPNGWDRALEEPIALPDGARIVTLRDAGAYIAALPARTQRKPEWQTATEVLLLVVNRNGPTIMARMGMTRALAAGKPRPAPGPRTKTAKTYRLIR